MKKSFNVFAIILTVAAAFIFSFVSGSSFAEHHDCEMNTSTDLNGNPCLVINKAFKARNGKGDSYADDYKMECTLQNIFNQIEGDSGYCEMDSDGNDGNTILFQSEINNEQKLISTITKIDNPVSINLNERTVILEGGYPVYWGDGDWASPFDIDCGGGFMGATRFCPEAYFDLDVVKRLNYEYRAEIDITDISLKSVTGAGLDLYGKGKLILRDLDVRAKCTLSQGCAPAVKLGGGAKLILKNAKIQTWTAALPGFSSVVRIENNEQGMFHDYIAVDGSAIISTAETEAVFSFKTASVITPTDFDGLKLGISEMQDLGSLETDETRALFWEKYRKRYGGLIRVDGMSPAKCILKPDLKSCEIDSLTPINFATVKKVWNEFLNTYVEFPLDPPYWFYIDEKENFNWRDVSARDSIYTLGLDNGILHENYVTMTNMGQVIRVERPKCPNEEDAILKNGEEGDSLTCKEPIGGEFDSVNWQMKCTDWRAHYEHQQYTIEQECVCMDGLEMKADGVCKLKNDLSGLLGRATDNSLIRYFQHEARHPAPSGDGDGDTDGGEKGDVNLDGGGDQVDLNDNSSGDVWSPDNANVDGAVENAANNDSSGGAFSCSLVTTSTPASSPLWILFVAFPMTAILWRRAGHRRDR